MPKIFKVFQKLSKITKMSSKKFHLIYDIQIYMRYILTEIYISKFVPKVWILVESLNPGETIDSHRSPVMRFKVNFRLVGSIYFEQLFQKAFGARSHFLSSIICIKRPEAWSWLKTLAFIKSKRASIVIKCSDSALRQISTPLPLQMVCFTAHLRLGWITHSQKLGNDILGSFQVDFISKRAILKDSNVTGLYRQS